jgi:hypothetical protein
MTSGHVILGKLSHDCVSRRIFGSEIGVGIVD